MSRSPTGSVPHTASSPPSARPSGARGRGRWGTPYVAWRSGCGRRASRCMDGAVRVPPSRVRRRHLRRGRRPRGRRDGAGRGRERRGGGGVGGDDQLVPWGSEPVADRGGTGGSEMTPEVRRTTLQRARDLFNAGEYWLAH